MLACSTIPSLTTFHFYFTPDYSFSSHFSFHFHFSLPSLFSSLDLSPSALSHFCVLYPFVPVALYFFSSICFAFSFLAVTWPPQLLILRSLHARQPRLNSTLRARTMNVRARDNERESVWRESGESGEREG